MITLITAAITAAIAIADFVPARFVLANSAEVGAPPSWLPALGAVKLAGAAGIVVGLLGPWQLGTAAAAGLVGFSSRDSDMTSERRVLYNIGVSRRVFAPVRGIAGADGGRRHARRRRSGGKNLTGVDGVAAPSHIRLNTMARP